MKLTNVSRTAIFTLATRVVTIEKKKLGLKDPKALICFDRLMMLATEEEKHQISKMKKLISGIFYHDARPNVERLMIIDTIVNNYISNNPGCTVINLACGFDTRFWRIDNKKCRYIEIDLPEVVVLKKEILNEHINYELIGCSILDYSWVDKVTTSGNKNFFIIAEGLLMYLPEKEGISFLEMLSRSFNHSQFTFDMFPKYITNRFWKMMIKWQAIVTFGYNVSLEFGFKKPNDIEKISSRFKVIETKKLGMRMIINSSINDV
jgi:O-methyltransferase involved in polyketide biosynthesis